MRNLILAVAAGIVLAASAGAAFAIPTTDRILNPQGQSGDQAAVGSILPAGPAFVYSVDGANNFVPATHGFGFGGQGATTGASVGGSGAGGHR